jgi:hypothetical protein
MPQQQTKAQHQLVPVVNAPMDGSILIGAGLPSMIRIPIPGTEGMAIELRPRGYPLEKSTSTLFVQEWYADGPSAWQFRRTLTEKNIRHYRLDYGYNPKTKTIDYHWNHDKGAYKFFEVPDHTPAGALGKWIYNGAKYYRGAGRVFVVAGVLVDLTSIVVATRPLQRIVEVAGGWSGAWAGAELVGAAGARIGALGGLEGVAIGGIVGGIAGGVGGYIWGEHIAEGLYTWSEHTVFIRLEQVKAPDDKDTDKSQQH